MYCWFAIVELRYYFRPSVSSAHNQQGGDSIPEGLEIIMGVYKLVARRNSVSWEYQTTNHGIYEKRREQVKK